MGAPSGFNHHGHSMLSGQPTYWLAGRSIFCPLGLAPVLVRSFHNAIVAGARHQARITDLTGIERPVI
jgi:hypothetical protein